MYVLLYVNHNCAVGIPTTIATTSMAPAELSLRPRPCMRQRRTAARVQRTAMVQRCDCGALLLASERLVGCGGSASSLAALSVTATAGLVRVIGILELNCVELVQNKECVLEDVL